MAIKVSAPAYVVADKKDREELLSQWGVSSTSQRVLFHELCSNWAPFLDYSTFVAPRTLTHKSLVSDIEVMFQKLRDCRVGVLSTKKDAQGQRIPDKLVLTDEGSPLYWSFYLSEVFRTGAENPKNPFLTESYLHTKGIPIDTSTFKEIPVTALVKSFIDENQNTYQVATLALGDEKLYCPLGDLATLVGLSSTKIRLALKNPDALTAVARVMNSNLTELSKKLESKEITFWKGLSYAALSGREELHRDMKASFDKSFFLACEIFHAYMENQIDEQQKLKDLAKERELDMKQIEQYVLQQEDVFIEPKQLETHIKIFKEKYKEGFNQFQDDFFQEYSQTTQKTGLPVLVELDYGFVHRHNLYVEIYRRYQAALAKVREEFLGRMDQFLRTNNRNGDVTFFSMANLEHSLGEFISTMDPVLGEVFKKTRLLAEAIIVYGKTQQGLKSIDEMKGLMGSFFKEGTMNLKDFRVLFYIQVSALFEESMKHLSLWRQLILRITGRYKGLKELFSGKSSGDFFVKGKSQSPRNSVSYNSPTAGGSGLDTPSGGDWDTKEGSARRSSHRRTSIYTSPRPTKKASEEEKKPVDRFYSEKETDSAWDTFSKNLKKKP